MQMNSKLAVIGGTGLYDLPNVEIIEKKEIKTPWGDPSSQVMLLRSAGVEFYFLARHGKDHKFTPSNVNYRANIAALKSLGVGTIVSFTAVGSLRESIAPRDFVLPLQFIDRTKFRKDTFFEDIVGHVSMADPFHLELQKSLQNIIIGLEIPVHFGATIVTMEGPAFSTRAESEMYRNWGCDIINMTASTECKLANEAGIAYGCVAMSTDYDCWKTDEEPVTVEYVIKNLRVNAENAKRVLIKFISAYKDSMFESKAVKDSILSDEHAIKKSNILFLFPELA